MKQLIIILISLLIIGCEKDSKLFDEVNKMAQFDKIVSPKLIQSGNESGFLQPIMEYTIFEIDTIAFQSLENAILTNKRFKEGKYYLNIELDDYMQSNSLDIVNMSNSTISDSDKTYHLYLLSDRLTFAVCKVNH